MLHQHAGTSRSETGDYLYCYSGLDVYFTRKLIDSGEEKIVTNISEYSIVLILNNNKYQNRNN